MMQQGNDNGDVIILSTSQSILHGLFHSVLIKALLSGFCINPILQMKTLRHRADKQCGQGHTVGKWQHQGVNQAIGLRSSGLIPGGPA